MSRDVITYDHAFAGFAFGPIPIRIPQILAMTNQLLIPYCSQGNDNINRLIMTYPEKKFCEISKIKIFNQIT